ncbi:MAG: hypothetical protein R2780_11665 [Crocinitomicaceae bacterium]|nr:hypothetical protein [Crocinitomicaceae bacterium]
MKLRLTIILTLLVSLTFGQEEFPIYDQISYIDKFDQVYKDDQLVIESPFAKADLSFPETFNWENRKVEKVTYYYSKNNINPTFEQNDLSNKRYINLISAFPQLGNADIEWETAVQSGCSTDECAKQLFHGFVIEFTKEMTGLVPEFQSVIGHDQLHRQVFKIDPNQQNVVKGKNGTMVIIPENAFEDKEGNIINSKVTISLKEAITLEDIVFGGLHTMTSDNQVLMSKGMIEIRATKGRHQLGLRDNKSLTVVIPTKYEEGYSYYNGEESEEGLKWNDPVPVTNQLATVGINERSAKLIGARFEKIRYADPVYEGDSLVAIKIHHWERDQLVTREDVEDHAVSNTRLHYKIVRMIKHWFRTNKFEERDLHKRIWINTCYRFPGLFGFARKWDGMIWRYNLSDPEMANIFQMNRMGWANVDCLAHLKNTQKTRFNIDLPNSEQYQELSMNLIIPRVNSMIPGFKLSNGNWSFTHGEYEDKVPMPRNEKVFVMVSGKLGDQQYFNIQEYKLGQKDINPITINEVSREMMINMIKNTF